MAVKGSFKDLVCCLLKTAIPTFGEEICYRPGAGGAFTFKAVFDENFIQIDPDTEEQVASNAPAIGIKESDIPFAPTNTDIVEIGKRRFKVVDSQEDGQGGITLYLNEVSRLAR